MYIVIIYTLDQFSKSFDQSSIGVAIMHTTLAPRMTARVAICLYIKKLYLFTPPRLEMMGLDQLQENIIMYLPRTYF